MTEADSRSDSLAEKEMALNRQLQLAAQQVRDAWFPVNPESLRHIRTGIESGIYDADRTALVRDIKSDFSLFLHAIKNLRKFLGESYSITDPIEALESLTNEHWNEILKGSELSFSSHVMGEMNEIQARQIQQSMVSAAASEVIAEGFKCDANLAYSCALFRQLGLTLISWNYPHVYRKTVLSSSSTDSNQGRGEVDRTLSKTLGFSPSLLGITMAKQFGMPPSLLVGMGDPTILSEIEDPSIKIVGDTLERICKAGEALARANDPEQYPTAYEDWDKAQKEIAPALGQSGMKRLLTRCNEALGYYAKSNPNLFKTVITIDPKKPGRSKSSSELLQANQYVKHCPPAIQEKLKSLYEKISSSSISKESIDDLVKDIIPATGFIKGCIYLIDPESSTLIPRLAIGERSLGRYRAVSYTMPGSDFDPIVAAYKCMTPIMEENVTVGNEQVSYVAGILGNVQRAGVLYLEISEGLLRSRNSNPMAYFKALRQALADCLLLL